MMNKRDFKESSINILLKIMLNFNGEWRNDGMKRNDKRIEACDV